VIRNSFKITNASRLYRVGNDVYMAYEHAKEKIEEEYKYLLQILTQDGNF
jgi:hypothetical protein